jgi:hypothetical protein
MDNIETRIKSDILKNSQKLKGKYLPFSEMVGGIQKIFPVKKLYKLQGDLKNFFLIEVKHSTEKQKHKQFLAIQLASQSSDFLVSVAKTLIKEKSQLRLIQFSIYPEHLRVGLLGLRRLDQITEIPMIINDLKEIRTKFRKKIDSLSRVIEEQ